MNRPSLSYFPCQRGLVLLPCTWAPRKKPVPKCRRLGEVNPVPSSSCVDQSTRPYLLVNVVWGRWQKPFFHRPSRLTWTALDFPRLHKLHPAETTCSHQVSAQWSPPPHLKDAQTDAPALFCAPTVPTAFLRLRHLLQRCTAMTSRYWPLLLSSIPFHLSLSPESPLFLIPPSTSTSTSTSSTTYLHEHSRLVPTTDFRERNADLTLD